MALPQLDNRGRQGQAAYSAAAHTLVARRANKTNNKQTNEQTNIQQTSKQTNNESTNKQTTVRMEGGLPGNRRLVYVRMLVSGPGTVGGQGFAKTEPSSGHRCAQRRGEVRSNVHTQQRIRTTRDVAPLLHTSSPLPRSAAHAQLGVQCLHM